MTPMFKAGPRLAAGLVFASVLAAPAHADNYEAPYQRQALEMYRHVIGLKTEVGEHQVPVMAQYLADKFRAAGFPDADIHIVPFGETAALVVRYRGDGS